MLAALSTVMLVTTAPVWAVVSPPIDSHIAPEARALFEQPLTGLEDVCEEKNGAQIRHVRFATLDASGQVEDRLELRTTTDGGPTRITEYLVNGTVVFIQDGDGLQPTSAGRQLLRAARGDRPAKLLAAFAAAHPRLLVADVEAPHHSCGALAGKAEETAKCSAIGVAGCSSGNAFVCAVSAGVAVLCVYLVDKVCEENPDSCQPGWTEG